MHETLDTLAEIATDALDPRAVFVPLVHAITRQLILGNRIELRQRIVDELATSRRLFVFDCTECGYIDSSGLGCLVSLAKKIRDAGGRLVIAGLNEDLKTLFELTKIDTLFTIVASVADAHEVLASGVVGDGITAVPT